jgi:hypothetical protein
MLIIYQTISMVSPSNMRKKNLSTERASLFLPLGFIEHSLCAEKTIISIICKKKVFWMAGYCQTCNYFGLWHLKIF